MSKVEAPLLPGPLQRHQWPVLFLESSARALLHQEVVVMAPSLVQAPLLELLVAHESALALLALAK